MKKNILLVFIFSYTFVNQIFAQQFTDSNLPIIIITTDNGEVIPDSPKILAGLKIIYKGEGVQNFVTDQNTAAFLDYDGRIGIEIRGSSSQALPKKGYGFSTLLADNVSSNNVSLLGMPSENDWILNGLAFDPSYIRDYLSYNISRNMGNYASRTTYCEVVINGEYVGLYVLQEKIKANSGRVDVTKITASQNTLPQLSGGYITKADKQTGGVSGDPIAWTMPCYLSGQTVDFVHDLPKPTAVTTTQNTYIESQFLSLSTAANTNNINFTDGYPSVIDVPSFVDFMLSNELGSNADAYQFSTYFHKDRNGKLRAGPIWDLNLTYGNDLFLWGFDRSHNNVWQFQNGDNEGAKFWRDLYNNSKYRCLMARRFYEITQPNQPMNPDVLNAFIDNTVNYISTAVGRDNQKWNTNNELISNVFALKNFIASRISWMTGSLGSFSNCENPILPNLVISKIHYNPNIDAIFTNSNDQEFIEIINASNQTVDLTGVYFKNTGFVFQFAANQSLAPQTSIYLASNSIVFQNRYGFVPYGEFTRNLSNKSQNLTLADGFGNTIDKVEYFDSLPWPNADGNGSFLQLTDNTLDNNLASSWSAVDVNLLKTTDFKISNTIQITPNPGKNIVLLQSKNEMQEVEIYDFSSRLMLRDINLGTFQNLDVSPLLNGIYLIKIKTHNGIETIKFIKK